ncbi:MAG TPA: chitobiase/beta-hexosaminidase C-terminal domain-containing protein, partial [Acidobacteriaceae bacterium]|nr:chitobiase/beta-hexosaminidase C-terminal domain-containing protein [Acidobacteriaceae bacterium]
QNVIMTDATPGAIIYYTTNGTTPTTASTKYSVAFHVYTAATIQAIAVAPGYANSAVATTALTFTAASPTFSPPPGTYDSPQTVTITSATSGSAIYYTTNGTTPNTSSRYTAPITVSTSETIKAFTGEGGYTSSPIVAAQYVITSSSSLGPSKPHPPGPGSPLPTR